MDRDAFLARVEAAVAAAILPYVPTEDPGLLVPDLPGGDIVERFERAVGAADGVVHRGDPVEVIAGLAERLQTDVYLGWDDLHAGSDGLELALTGRGLRRLSAMVPSGIAERRDHQAGYMGVKLGVTGAEAGFAETGSVVVRSGAGRPRMASLIPEVHVALLPLDSIHLSLAHWARDRSDTMAAAANVVFITGPSRTGDIEMRLNKGVHGPRELHVVLI